MRLRPAFIHGTLVILISTFIRERQMPSEGVGSGGADLSLGLPSPHGQNGAKGVSVCVLVLLPK